VHESSPECPAELSVYQFGSQVGFGASRNDMHLARVVDTAMAWAKPGIVQFQTQCSGLQWEMDMAVAGEFEEQGGQTQLTIFRMLPWHNEGSLEVQKCMYKKNRAERLYGSPCSHTTVTVLAVLFVISLLAAGVMGTMLWIFRRREVADAIGQHYAAFTT